MKFSEQFCKFNDPKTKREFRETNLSNHKLDESVSF